MLKIKTYYDLETNNVFRKPDWRLQRANTILEDNKRQPSREDDETLTIARQLGVKFRRKLTLSKVGLVEALALPQTHSVLLPELQAWLLTGATDEQLASRFGLPVEVINWYERSQFDVRRWVRHRDWVMRSAICKPWDRVRRTADIKPECWFAYFGGPMILECYYSTIKNEPFPDWMTKSRVYSREADQLRLRAKLLIQEALLTCRSEAELRRIIRVYEQLCQATDRPIPPYLRILDICVSKKPRRLSDLEPQIPKDTPSNNRPTTQRRICVATVRRQIVSLIGSRT